MASAEQKARLQFRCRRGMLELDELFERFLTSRIDNLSEQQLAVFDKMLDEPDPVLLDWLLGKNLPKDKSILGVLNLFSRV